MVTATQLASYLYCPRKLFLSSILKIEEPPKEELIKGKIWHETYELINNSDEKLVCSIKTNSYPEIVEIYRAEYSKILRNIIIKNKSELKKFDLSMLDLFKDYWPHFEEEAKEHALNVAQFIKKTGLFGFELWSKLTPKILSEQYFKSEKLNLSGIIDVLEIHVINQENSDVITYVPVELKTGKVPQKGMWDGHRVQLGAYMLLLEDSGKKVSEAVLKYKGADKRVLQLNTFLRDEVMDLIYKTSSVLKNSSPPDHTDNKNKCTSCQFKDVCYDSDAMKIALDSAISKKTPLQI
jgi:CRISPR-associated protein Cas4